MINVPMYDIFSGTCYRDARWLEAVEGLGAAQKRMKQLAERADAGGVLRVLRGI